MTSNLPTPQPPVFDRRYANDIDYGWFQDWSNQAMFWMGVVCGVFILLIILVMVSLYRRTTAALSSSGVYHGNSIVAITSTLAITADQITAPVTTETLTDSQSLWSELHSAAAATATTTNESDHGQNHDDQGDVSLAQRRTTTPASLYGSRATPEVQATPETGHETSPKRIEVPVIMSPAHHSPATIPAFDSNFMAQMNPILISQMFAFFAQQQLHLHHQQQQTAGGHGTTMTTPQQQQAQSPADQMRQAQYQHPQIPTIMAPQTTIAAYLADIHDNVLEGIRDFADPNLAKKSHKLWIVGTGNDGDRIDRHSIQYMVNFIDDRDSHEVITELELCCIEPSYGGLQVLGTFFSRSDTTLTTVALDRCCFSNAEETAQLLAAFEINQTVTDLSINDESELLEGAALGNCISGLMQNMSQLQRFHYDPVGVEVIRAFQPALQVNRTLRELSLVNCYMRDDGIRLIADALVGNTTMQVLNIGYNGITSTGLDDFTRILQSTQLRDVNFGGNDDLFKDVASAQRFSHVLSRHEFLKKLRLPSCDLEDQGIHILVGGLVGNAIMELLDISFNGFTSIGLEDITRMIESTKLKTIIMRQHGASFFCDVNATQHFVSTLQHKVSCVQELPEIGPEHSPGFITASQFASINWSLKRNQQLNRVNLLLVPPSPHQQQQPQNARTTLMLKIAHKAITKFAMVSNHAGASAIFKLFQARPQLLEKRLKRPTQAAAVVSHRQKRQPTQAAAVVSHRQKRQCL